MKSFFLLLGVAAAGGAGYMAEPRLRFQLTGYQPSAVELGKETKVGLQFPGELSQVDLASLTPEQLPQRVLLNADVKVTDAASGVTMVLQAGNRVKLVRIEGGNAVVSPGDGPFLGLIPVGETDIFQQIAALRQTLPPTTPPAVVVPDPVVPPAGDSEEPEKMPEPPPVPEPAPAPDPVPPPAPEPAGVPATPEEVVKAMQESIKTAQIKEFTFDQVLEWKAEADETVDGEIYQTGLASYKAETIFGVKNIQAKALVKGGKVQRWIWPKSGMEIK